MVERGEGTKKSIMHPTECDVGFSKGEWHSTLFTTAICAILGASDAIIFKGLTTRVGSQGYLLGTGPNNFALKSQVLG